MLGDPDGGEEDLQRPVWVSGIQRGLHPVDDAGVEAFEMEGRLVEHERSQQRRLDGGQEAVDGAARVSDEVGAVAGDGKDGEQVFDFTLEGVAGSIATAASPSAGVHPHRVVFGEHVLR